MPAKNAKKKTTLKPLWPEPVFKRPKGAKPIGTWQRMCGYCGKEQQVVTDGRMLMCGVCGH